jgi:tagatose-1,6-bisphosphate aldolase
MVPKIDVTVTKEQTTEAKFLLTIENTDSVDITKKTYVYIKDLNDNDTFENIASVFDINTYSEDVPASGHNRFRTEKVELEFDSVEEMNRVEVAILADIKTLVNDWKSLEGSISTSYDVEVEAD